MRPRLALTLCVVAAWAWLHQGALSYIFHHPSSVDAGIFLQGLRAAARLAAAAWLLAAAAGLGQILLRPLRLPYADPGEGAVLEAAAGLGAISHILFAFGLLGLWTAPALTVLMAVLSIPAWTGLHRLRAGIRKPRPMDATDAFFAFPIILAALYAWLCANAPPTEWDSTAVHLVMPKVYAALGGLRPLRDLAHAFDPMAVELFYVPAMVFRDPAFSAMVTLLFQGLMAAALLVCGRQIVSRPVAWAALALFVSQPAVIHVSGTPGTDFGVGLFAMLAFWTAWRALQSGEGRWLILSGALSGLAAVSKTTGVFLAAALALALGFAVLRRQRALRPWAWGWLAAAAVCAAPWFLRNFVCTHNPIWPYLPWLFGGDSRDPYLFARVKAATLEGLGTGWLQFILLPINLILRPESFRHTSTVLVLPFLAFGLASWRAAKDEPFTGWFLPYIGIFTLLWFSAVQNWRYFVPLMPWMCLLTCGWAASLWPQGGWRKALSCALAIGFMAVPAMSANNELFAMLRLKSQDPSLTPEEAYLSRAIDSYPAMRAINRTFPVDAKILLYREVRTFYLERDYIIGDPQNEMLLRYEELRTPEELYRRLRELDVTNVLVDPRLATFNPAVPGFARAEELMKAVLSRFAATPLEVNGVLIFSWRTP